MAKDSENTKVWKGTGITLGEIASVVGGSMNLGALCQHTNLNCWAKYKPFRNSSLFFANASAWESAMAAAGYGFGNILNTVGFHFNSANPYYTPEWKSVYEKPRGVNSSYNEPYRQLDFVDLTANSTYGYDKTAVPPVAITFPNYLHQAGSSIYISANIESNGSAIWGNNNCVSYDDVLGGLSGSTVPYHYAVLFRSSSWPNLTDANLLIINSTPVTSASTITVGGPTSGACVLPMFADTGSGIAQDGDTIYTTVCLATYPTGSFPGSGYVVLTGSAISSDTSIVSLNFQNNMDKTTLEYVKIGSIRGTEVSVSGLSISNGGASPSGGRILRFDSFGLTLNQVGPNVSVGQQIQYKVFINVYTYNWFRASDTYYNTSTVYAPSGGGTYMYTDTSPIIDGDNQTTHLFTIPQSATHGPYPIDMGVQMAWNGSLAGKIALPYIDVPSDLVGTSVAVTVSGYMFTGADNANSRINFQSQTINITVQ